MKHLTSPKVTSFQVVSCVFVVSLILVVVYFAVTQDSSLWPNIIATVFGLGLGLFVGYRVVDKKIAEEKRSRFKSVEHDVLDGVLLYSVAVIRRVGIFTGVQELSIKLDEDDPKVLGRVQSFAKEAIRVGVSLPESPLQLQKARQFLAEADDMLNSLFSLQRDFPFVFEEYPSIAKALVGLRIALVSVKSAFWWYGSGDSIDGLKHKGIVERRLTTLVRAADAVAEEVSPCLGRLRA